MVTYAVDISGDITLTWGEKNFVAQYAGNTPGEAVRIKSKMFDIFGLARQIPLCVRPSWSTSRNRVKSISVNLHLWR